jgi:uncharacterized protein (TIGR00266 family)
MADIIDYKIYGNEMQLVEIELDPREGVRAEVGAMMYMDRGIKMQTSTGGGIFKGFKRIFTGESFFITTFLNNVRYKQKVAFAAPYPGKIIPIDLSKYNGTFICQKESYLCSANGIDIEVEFTKKIGVGLFGGEGFILQRLNGDGLVFISAGGTIIPRELREHEELMVDTGCIVGFSENVSYDIEFVGGFKNALFGGEGLFLAKVRGPGVVLLQSLPFSRLADRISAASKFKNVGESKGLAGIGGSLLGGLISGDNDF